jgi:hypothetical protein
MRRLVGTFQTDHGPCATGIASAPDAKPPDDSGDGLRFSTLQGLLLAHSQYPTLAPDSVFFGPDTYRFAALISRVLYGCPSPPRAILDLGCGSGVGNIVAARRAGGRPFLALADVNPAALRLA